MDLNKCIL